MDVAANEGFKTLAVGELGVQHPAVTFDQEEGVQLASVPFVVQGAKVSPVDLKALARRRLHTQISPGRRTRADPLQMIAQDGDAAGIAQPPQMLKDDRPARFGILFQQLQDQLFERVEFAGATTGSRNHHRAAQVLANGATTDLQMASDFSNGPLLAVSQSINGFDLGRIHLPSSILSS